MAKRRYELSASGVDDGLQGLSSDPYGLGSAAGAPQGPGLRIPPVLPSDTGPEGRPRYLCCLATRTVNVSTRLMGARQGLTLGMNFASIAATTPQRPIELQVTTPGFHFSDGNVSWHLVLETNTNTSIARPTTDAQNWALGFSDGPAFLYKTFANSATTPSGAPIIYTQGLTAYTPPDRTAGWQPIFGDLVNFHDVRFPLDSNRAWEAFGSGGILIPKNGRVSLYASILQTNPNTRAAGPANPPPPGTPPEEAFIAGYTAGGGELPVIGPIFWRIYGSLIFEDDEGDSPKAIIPGPC